ncbi:MAG: hypothetical protein ACREMB_10805 [Candidatus Rokuibacteriota bacterium]
MLMEILFVGGAAGMIAGVLQAASRRRRERWTTEAAVREAMSGPESQAVRAEFRRSGIIPPARARQPRGAVFF